MASKLDKLKGIPRVATHDMVWKTFNVKQGYAYGVDDNGRLYVSPGMPAANGRLFLWRASDETQIKCVRRAEVLGPYSRALCGHQQVIMAAGFYGTSWGLIWRTASIQSNSVLAQRIMAAKKQAAPCKERDPFHGLSHMQANHA